MGGIKDRRTSNHLYLQKPTSLNTAISMAREFQTIFPPREEEEKNTKKKGQINATQNVNLNNPEISKFIPRSQILTKEVKAKPSPYNDFKGS